MLRAVVALTVVPEPFELVSLPWESQPGRWSLSLCLRATFALVHAGECEPLEVQSACFTMDGSWDEANEKILHLADQAPFKPRADVLVIGHAHAPWGRPVRALVARVRVGDLTKAVRVVGTRTWRWVGQRWVAGEPRPFTTMALRWETALRTAAIPVGLDPQAPPVEGSPAGPTLEPVNGGMAGLGPIPPGWPQRYGLVDEEALEWALNFAGGGPVAGAPPPRFPFQFFNVAPPDQQVDLMRPGAPLVLEHLSSRWPLLATHLPSARPRVSRVLGGGRRVEVALKCDTLWIDSDRGAITMLWRGLIDIDGPAHRPELHVTVDGMNATPHITVPRTPAPTAAAKRMEQTQDVPLATVDRAMAALPFADATHDEVAGAIVDEGSTTESGQRLTPTARESSSTAAPPFPARASAPSFTEGLGGGGALRLRPAAVTAPPPPVPGPKPPPSAPRSDAHARGFGPPARVDAPAPVAPPRVVAPPAVESLARAEPPARLDAPMPPPAEPPPRPPPVDPEGVDLATCAAVAADLAQPGVDRTAALAERGLDDAGWARIDRRWKQAIDQDARKGSTALLETYDDAFLQALGRHRQAPIGVAEYARISVAQKRGDLAEVLESLHFPRIELLRLTRVWTRRAKADATLATELKAAIAAEEKKK